VTNSSAIRAGRAYVELFADDKPLKKGLQSAQKELSRYAAQVAGTQQKIADIGKQADAPFKAGAEAPALRSGRCGCESHPRASRYGRFTLAMPALAGRSQGDPSLQIQPLPAFRHGECRRPTDSSPGRAFH
jgi:hypothetical protein